MQHNVAALLQCFCNNTASIPPLCAKPNIAYIICCNIAATLRINIFKTDIFTLLQCCNLAMKYFCNVAAIFLCYMENKRKNYLSDAILSKKNCFIIKYHVLYFAGAIFEIPCVK